MLTWWDMECSREIFILLATVHSRICPNAAHYKYPILTYRLYAFKRVRRGTYLFSAVFALNFSTKTLLTSPWFVTLFNIPYSSFMWARVVVLFPYKCVKNAKPCPAGIYYDFHVHVYYSWHAFSLIRHHILPPPLRPYWREGNCKFVALSSLRFEHIAYA